MEPLFTVLVVLAQIALCIAIADVISGLFHWAEDSYGQEHWPVVGKAIITPNLLHHEQPRAFLANSWWRSADVQILGALWSAFVLLLVGWLTWRVVLVLALVVNANELHKWAHRTKAENGRLITYLQQHGVLQSKAHHNRHHGGKRNTHYCTITPYLNPLFDRFGVWRGCEGVIARVTGVGPRV